MTDDSRLLAEQTEYYRARAGEYDDWFFRTGRYDRGSQDNARWLAEVAAVEQALAASAPLGDVVELAAGTGIWTRWLGALADRVLAVDVSDEMLTINRARVRTDKVEHVRADVFEWDPPRQFDAAFFGFWLSHVPLDRFDGFWDQVESLVGADGHVFFVDSLYRQTSTAVDHELEGSAASSVLRRLDDGRQFRIVKVFHDPEELEARLRRRGWDIAVRTTGDFFLYGYGQR